MVLRDNQGESISPDHQRAVWAPSPGCGGGRLAGSQAHPRGPGPPPPGGHAATGPQGHLLFRLVTSLESWVHWTQMGWGHDHVLEAPRSILIPCG